MKQPNIYLAQADVLFSLWNQLILKDQQIEEVIWVENFLSAETTAKHT